MKQFTDQTLNKMQRELADHYAENVSAMSQMIIQGLETEEHKHISVPNDVEVIANNEGYARQDVLAKGIEGNILNVNIDNEVYPIGYNIFIPNGVARVNKVVVSAYGGFTRSEATLVATPASPYRMAALLLNEGCVFIDLNLPDYLQTIFQSQMDAKLQLIVHASIHAFFEKISQNPEALSARLANRGFERADFYLMGGSFGGRTAIRHGQLYPSTFKGYISHDGALTGPRYKHGKDVLPIHHVKDTNEPVLILQNCDDNNVNVDVAIKFYEALVSAGKQELARICFFEKGSPIPDSEDKWNKGHFYTDNELPRYMSTIVDFLHNGPPAIPEFNAFHFHKNQVLMSGFSKYVVPSNYFISRALHKFYQNKEHQLAFNKPEAWNAIWETDYQSMAHAVEEIYKLSNEDKAYNERMTELNDAGLLTDEVISNAIKYHSAIYREYYKETSRFKEVSLEDIYDNPFIIEHFRKMLVSSAHSSVRKFMLESLYLGNPTLLPNNRPNLSSYKDSLEKNIGHSRAHLKKTWHAEAKKVIAKQKEQRETFDVNPSKTSLLQPSVLYEHLFFTDTFFIGNALESKIAYDSKQANLLHSLSDIIHDELEGVSSYQAQSKDLSELNAIVSKTLRSPEYELSDIDIAVFEHYLNNQQTKEVDKVSQVTSHVIYHILLLDKARCAITPQNLTKAIKRQLLIQPFLNDDKIEYQARRAFTQSIHELFPELSQSMILSLIKNIQQGRLGTGSYSIQGSIKEDNTALARALLQMGVVTQQATLNDTILESACRTNDVKLIELLLANGELVTPKCLESAIESDSAVIQLLLKHGIDPLEQQISPVSSSEPRSQNRILDNPIYCRMIYRALTEQDEALKEIVEQIAIKHACEDELQRVVNVTMSLIRDELSEAEIIDGIKEQQISLTFKDENGQNLMMMAAKNNNVLLGSVDVLLPN